MTILMFFLGLAGLVGGAEVLVRGASRLGLVIGISPLVIGLTIVAFGTSSPEIAVSVKAVLTNHSDIVLGTCVGSSIFNILVILGLSALATPLVVSKQLIWYEVPIMIGAHLLLLAMCYDGKIDKIDALVLLGGIVVYTVFVIRKGRYQAAVVLDKDEKVLSERKSQFKLFLISKELGKILLGLVFCVLGAGWLLDSVVILAQKLGLSELVIGLTLVAASTSFPELATSVLATIRGHRDIAVGNVIGSNIFNVFGIVGISALIAPEGIPVAPSLLRFDLPVAIAACIACLPIFFSGHKISRWEGFLFLTYYVTYISYLIMAAQEHDSLPLFSMVMLWFVVPLTLIGMVVVMYRAISDQKKS